jgi:Ca2+-transporting ATPase
LLDTAQLEFNSQTGLFSLKGDPTEAAMGVFAQKMGFHKEVLEQEYKKLYEIPFDSRLQYHAGFFQKGPEGIAFVIGSAELLAHRAHETSPSLKVALEHMLNNGLRVLAIAKKSFSLEKFFAEHAQKHDSFSCCKHFIEKDLELLGFVGIEDAVRPDVRSVVEQVRAAGIRVIMVTGDHKKTALFVAKKVGLFKSGDLCVDGAEFAHMADEEVLEKLEQITVYSRMTPRDKFRIVTLYHKKKKLVAMTGDGINDVPPLVAADLGIAMGSIGTEIAKEAADLILLQDSFVTIVDAIKQSRHIFYTLRRVVLYFFATNMGELLIVVFALLANLPLPITAVQILWLNLVTDGFLDVALSTEKPEPDLLYKKGWHGHHMRLVDRNLLAKMVFVAILMGIGSIWVFSWYYAQNLALAQTMTLLTMAMFQWFNAWNCRSESKSLFQIGVFSNRWFLAETVGVLVLQFFLIYNPFMRSIFYTVPLTAAQWGLIVAVSSPIILLEEVRKLFARHWFESK